jgi:hypothetical protein
VSESWDATSKARNVGSGTTDVGLASMHNLERVSDKLTGLRKVGPSVGSRMLARKTHLPVAILLHLFQLILNDDSLVNQMLKI